MNFGVYHCTWPEWAFHGKYYQLLSLYIFYTQRKRLTESKVYFVAYVTSRTQIVTTLRYFYQALFNISEISINYTVYLKCQPSVFFWAFYYFVKGPNNVIYTQIFSDKRNQLPWTVLHWQTTRKATDVNWRYPSSSWIISSQYYASAVKQARAF